MIIAVDFDGTCVTHKYPEIGEDVGADKVLKKLVDNGHKIILLTMRSHKEYNGRDLLDEAVNWFKERNIDLYSVNENPQQKSWTDSQKVYAQCYIDDAALGCPLKMDNDGNGMHVDWEPIDAYFTAVLHLKG